MHCIKGFVTIKYVNTQKTPFCVDKVAQIAPGRPQTPDFGQKWLNNAPKMPQITREKKITACVDTNETHFCVASYITSEQPQGSKIGHHPKILFPPHYAFLSVSNKPSLTAHRPFGPARCTRRLEIIIISLTLITSFTILALVQNLITRWHHML